MHWQRVRALPCLTQLEPSQLALLRFPFCADWSHSAFLYAYIIGAFSSIMAALGEKTKSASFFTEELRQVATMAP